MSEIPTEQPSHVPSATATVTAAALELVDLHKEFRLGLRLKRVHAVRGVTLRVEPGEIFGYLGPNGAGKTTTMKMAMGLIGPTSGAIKIFGEPAESAAVRRRVGYLPEHPYFYDYLTCRELLDFYGRLFAMSSADRRARIDHLVALVGLSHAATRRLRSYSKGMLQRAGIAQALINDPDFVVLDEPLSGLDPVGRKEVRDIILSLRDAGKTIFLSSHILHDIEAVCDRVAIIDRGRIVRVGSVEDLVGGGAGVVDVTARSVRDDVVSALRGDGLGVVGVGGAVTLTVPERSVSDVLRRLLDAGATVTHVNPHRDSLEDLFIRQAGGGDVAANDHGHAGAERNPSEARASGEAASESAS